MFAACEHSLRGRSDPQALCRATMYCIGTATLRLLSDEMLSDERCHFEHGHAILAKHFLSFSSALPRERTQ